VDNRASERNNQASWVSQNALVIFLIAAYALSWAVQVPLALQANGVTDTNLPLSVHYLSAYGPMVTVIFTTATVKRWTGLMELGQRMTMWRVKPAWWGVALTPILLAVLVLGAVGAISGQSLGVA